jgi:hypothetical protein
VRDAAGIRNNRRNPHKYGLIRSIRGHAAQQHGRVARRASTISFGKMHGEIAHRADEPKNLQLQAVTVPHETQLRPKPLR